MKAIFDTSSLILIAKIDIARDVAESIAVIVPPKVQQEALSKKSYDAEIIRQLLKEGKILIRDVDHLQALKSQMILNFTAVKLMPSVWQETCHCLLPWMTVRQ
jgi:hypothetical protein